MEHEKHCHGGCGCHEHTHEHSHSHEHGHGHGHEHSHGHEHGNAGSESPAVLIASAALLLAALVLPLGETLKAALSIAAYLLSGFPVLRAAAGNIVHAEVFDESFLMALASLGAIGIGDFPEAAAVMLLYQIGEMMQDKAVESSRRTIRSLMDARADHANVVGADGAVSTVAAENVAVGSVIEVRPGEKIALDGVVIDGTSTLDTSALTGESLPREITLGGSALAGCVNLSGVLRVRVEKPFGESSSSKILKLVESAEENKARQEQFITRFARVYTPAVVIAAAVLALVPPLLGLGAWSVFLKRALSFLVISCPCALVISVPLSFFSGLGCASHNGILVKGSNYLEALAKAEIAAFDKTGTLTRGTFSVSELRPASDMTKETLLETAAYAEYYSNHPLSKSVLSAYGLEVDASALSEALETAGNGVSVLWNGKRLIAGKADYLRAQGVAVADTEDDATVIHVASEGTYCGAVLLRDTLKTDAAEGIRALKRAGVKKVVMLSGDAEKTAAAIAAEVGIDEVHAQLLPQDKLTHLETLRRELSGKGKLLFTGDGINDAPVLAAADVGIAMGGLGADAAMEAADVVIMGDEPSKIALAIRIARKTVHIARENVASAIAVKIIALAVGAIFGMSLWLAVFADVGVCILAVLNALRTLRV